MLKLKISLAFICCALLLSCSANIKDYANTGPKLQLEHYFNGSLVAYGIVQDRSGQVLRRFKVDLHGSWQQAKNPQGQEILKGTLVENFYFDDGETQQRIWYLTKQADGQYTGKASDVSQDAIGTTQGFALNWSYSLAIDIDDDTWNIDFDDWMYLLDEQRLINRATMSKWGFKVGEVTLWMEKLKQAQLN